MGDRYVFDLGVAAVDLGIAIAVANAIVDGWVRG